MRPRSLRLLLLLIPLALAALLLLAACEDEEGDGGETPTAAETPAETPEPTVEAIDITGVAELDDGVLTIGSDIAYAPIEYLDDDQNPVGLDVDLMTAMAAVLGVRLEFQQVADFGAIVEDLKTGRYDIVVSAIRITPAREAEIDFIPYFGPVATGILVPAGNPKGITTPEDLCGLKVAAQVGTFQVDQVNGSADVEGLNENLCAGNPITLTTFPDNPTAVQELTLRRVDAELADDPVAAYSAAQSEGALEVAISRFPDPAPYGIGVRKDSPELKAVLQEALDRIMADGTYLALLQKWEQELFALQ